MPNMWRVEALAQDVKHAWRILARNPGFSAVVILTLALGIGANTAIASLAYSVLVKPLPYVQPDQLYTAEVIIPERREQIPSLPATLQTFLRWRAAQTPFAGVAALTPWEASLTGDGEPERIGGAKVSGNFFSLLGVPMALGRDLSLDDEQPGRDRVVVISDALWRRRYAADPAVIGRTIVINGQSHVVAGIAPESLLVATGTQLHALLPFAARLDIWKPITREPRTLNNESWDHGVLVRLADPGAVEQGRLQFAAELTELARTQMPGIKTVVEVRLAPLRETFAGAVRLRLLLVLAASSLLLLTACASVANVLLARMTSRASEFATRVALGAGRTRILSQTLTEAALLATLGGAAGVLIAAVGARLLTAYGPDDIRLLADAGVNAPLLVFAITATVVTGALCALVPAWQAFRRDPAVAMQEAARGTVGGGRGERSRRVLVGVEMALATMLLAAAGLLLHSFVNVMRTDRGYDVERVLTVDLSLFGDRYAAGPGRAAFYSELVDSIRARQGVLQAGAISNLPAVAASEGASRTIFLTTDTNFQRTVLSRPVAVIRSVTAGYFAASGSGLRAGRVLTDNEPAPVALVSESLAGRLWPGEAPAAIVGRQLRQGDVSSPILEVVGVVAEARPGGLDRTPAPVIYRPYRQWASGPMTLVVRTAQDPADLALAVRAEIRRMDPDLPIVAMRTMREIVSSSVAQRRFQMTLTSLFAMVALLLGAVGVYGVVSCTVAGRTREIGLRMALGALRFDVMRWVFADGMRPVLAGLAAGMAGAIAMAQALRGVLFGIAPTDPLSLGIVLLVLLSTSALACYLPARRAAALDPMMALRQE